MATFLLHHRHRARECDATFAAWHGFDSPLRGSPASSTCLVGGHEIWWRVEADDAGEALAQLPPYLAERTAAITVRPVDIP